MKSGAAETGTVLEVDGTEATVITNKSSACQECGKAQAGICGKQGWGITLVVDNGMGARKGDLVELELPVTTHAAAYFIVFIVPVVVLFTASYMGYLISQATGMVYLDVITGMTGLVISILFSIKKIRGLDRTSRMRISKIISFPSASCSVAGAEETDYLQAYGRQR